MNKEITNVFKNYHKSRVKFVQKIAELSSRPRNISALQSMGVMDLLRPLLIDKQPSVQQSAALALGRLAKHSEELAEGIITGEILPQLIYSLAKQNKYFKRSAAQVLKSVAKHGAKFAQAVVDSGAVEVLVDCLDETDPGVRKSASEALGFIAKHTPKLARAIVEKEAVGYLVTCVQEPEITLKRAAAATLANICYHSPDLAQIVVDSEAISNLTPLIESSDSLLKRKVCLCLGNIAKHSLELAELVVEGEIFPKIFVLLKEKDKLVKKNSCLLVREICKHSKELCKLVVGCGGLPEIVHYIESSDNLSKIPGIMTLGYISSFSETMATAVIKAKAIPRLGIILSGKNDNLVLAATAWTLGQIGFHSSDHSRAVAESQILKKLFKVYLSKKATEDTKEKCKNALKLIVQKCVYLDPLTDLLDINAPLNILKYLVAQFAKILPKNVKAKKAFVLSKGFSKLQSLKVDENTQIYEDIQKINKCFPPEVVEFYTKDRETKLLDLIQ